ncbi:HAD hydrolase-like protein [Cellulosimicrobium terreum]|nr:HAD hydrolase-like protein [Cellulosimicrobium terreum]
MSAPRLVLLDLDGTLADSARGIVACIRHAFGALGLPAPDDAVLRRHIGPPLAEAFVVHGVPADRVDAAVAAYREMYTTGGMYDVDVFPGIPQCLADLRATGSRLALATSKPDAYAPQIVAHLGLDRYLDRGLDDVFGASLDATRGSKAAVIGHALTELGADDPALADLPVDQVVMVGDREHDVHGAAEHGISCVGVAWGNAEPGELERAGAVAVVDDPAGLTRFLLA